MKNEFWKAAAAIAAVIAVGIALLMLNNRQPYGPPLLAECDLAEMELVIHLQPDEQGVEEAYRRIMRDEPNARQRRGFHATDPVTGKHHVWIPDLRGQYDSDRLETWGHELAHVVCGAWHP